MVYRNPINYVNQFFSFFSRKFREIYLNSNIYNKKISKIYKKDFRYKPSQNLLDCLIKYEGKKLKIENYALESIWNTKNINEKDFQKLNSFFWLFSLDLKSSKNQTQSVILNWIQNNSKYNSKSWKIDITSKRIIAWLSNSKLTYEESDFNYKANFDQMVQKQTNHLVNEISKSKWVDDKMIGCSAIILVGLSYEDKDNYLNFGINLLKKIIKYSFDTNGFPKSRNIRQLNFYLKYFVLIREWFRESQNEIPEYIDETIYYLGQAYAFFWQDTKNNSLFNGNLETDNLDFDVYLKRLGYKFKNENIELGGYTILKNKKVSLIMDIGPSPEKRFSYDYQSGALSFEIISNGIKLLSNCGYFQNQKHKFNELSKTTAAHNSLIIDNRSSCKFEKVGKSKSTTSGNLKILKKNITFEKNFWKISAAHDGYLKTYKAVHERNIEFYPEQMKFIGYDKIISKDDKSLNFDIRFHLQPKIKLMKTLDNKSILIELNDEGWKFVCNDFDINIENGLYFGKKNFYQENQNFFISGMTQSKNQTIKWELNKI